MDFYLILGIERAATPGDIKRAYKRLARKFHPDINPGDRLAEAQFRQIAEAYETLSDPDRRRRYDAVGQVSGGPVSRRRPSAICSGTCCAGTTSGARSRRRRAVPICTRRSC
jgi:curved DNA-binding protein CbpA